MKEKYLNNKNFACNQQLSLGSRHFGQQLFILKKIFSHFNILSVTNHFSHHVCLLIDGSGEIKFLLGSLVERQDRLQDKMLKN
jgi:hypothetical protein